MVSFLSRRSYCCYQFLLIAAILVLFLTTTQATTTNDKEFIVEFSTVEQTKLFLKENENDIKKVRYTYDTDILIGTAVEFKNHQAAKSILFHYPDIIQYWPIHHRIKQQAPIPSSFNNNDNSNHADEDGDDVVVTNFVPQKNDTLSILTQANNVYKNLNSNGAGIKVGIIDSGVDYTLPALGGCFGVGCKVAYGHDLVGNDYDGTQGSIKESNDPIDNCPANSTSATGHGTFITGIIAAEDKTYNWNGVAPGVTIGMWKVYGCNYPTVPNDIMIKAMEMAYKAKMDVINISLGISGGWAEDVLSIVADRLVSKGVHVITASGNIGTSGIFLTASPATGKNVIASGSTMNKYVPGYILKLSNQQFQNNNTNANTANNDNSTTLEIPYRTFVNTPLVLNGTLPLVATSKQFNAENDACQNSTHHNNLLKDSIALIHTGGCNSLTKIMHARQAGAKAVILYTDVRNATTGYEVLTNAVLPVVFINHDDGNTAFYQANHAQFTDTLIAMEASESEISSEVSGFSTLGPTNELELKPELMAVGASVFSTLPQYRKSYGFASGTSFASPYIAGSVALLLANTRLDLSPDQVKSLLMNSASQVKGPISAVHYGDSPIRQGAGVIDVVQAIENYNQFRVSPAKLSLNDTAHFEKEHLIEIYNQNLDKESTFIISHLPSLTVTGYSIDNKDNSTSDFAPREPIGLNGQDNSTAMVTFSNTTLIIPAGKSLQVRVQFEPPHQSFSLQSHALYGGYISIKEQEGTYEATIPYVGMIGNMHDLPILDRSTNPTPSAQYTFPSIGLANGLSILKSNEVGHFHIQDRAGGPYILARLLTGTKLLQFQILNKENQIVGDVPIDETRSYMMRNTLTVTEYSKSYYTWQWHGDYVPKDVTLSGTNGEYKPAMLSSGEYKIKIRGLRVFGDIENDRDWDEWISPNLMLKVD